MHSYLQSSWHVQPGDGEQRVPGWGLRVSPPPCTPSGPSQDGERQDTHLPRPRRRLQDGPKCPQWSSVPPNMALCPPAQPCMLRYGSVLPQNGPAAFQPDPSMAQCLPVHPSAPSTAPPARSHHGPVLPSTEPAQPSDLSAHTHCSPELPVYPSAPSSAPPPRAEEEPARRGGVAATWAWPKGGVASRPAANGRAAGRYL